MERKNQMASTLLCKITKRKHDGTDVWEGTVNLTGAKPTKLVKSGSQDSLFTTKSGVATAARSFAKRHNFAEVKFDEPKSDKTPRVRTPKVVNEPVSAATSVSQ